MRLTKFHHSCVLVETEQARVLIDPGTFTPGFEDLTDLTAVLVTHQHPDHVDVDRLPILLERNPSAALYADEGTVGLLAGTSIDATAVHSGDILDVGVAVSVHGGTHGVVHPDVPVIPNVAYLVDGRFYHPGDSWATPGTDVEILGLPTGAPWIKTSEAVDFLRAQRPRVAVPIHEAILARPAMYYALFERLKPQATELAIIEPGASREF